MLNDFVAIAAALPALTSTYCRRIGGDGDAVAAAPLAVLGLGTELGVAGLMRDEAGRHIGVAGEGGHVTLAATTNREAAVLAQFRQRFGHASAERALLGPGLVNLTQAICPIDALPCTAMQPADVAQRALAGGDAACTETLELFGAFLGSVAGSRALTLVARRHRAMSWGGRLRGAAVSSALRRQGPLSRLPGTYSDRGIHRSGARPVRRGERARCIDRVIARGELAKPRCEHVLVTGASR